MATDNHAPIVLTEPLRVLIIDDKPVDQRLAQDAFEATGLVMEFGFASSYEEALESLFQEYFDVAVIDLVLHEGELGPLQDWEGFDILQEIFDRGLHADIVVFINSAFASTPDVAREALYNFRVADLWDKRFDRATLTQSVQMALKREHYFGLTCQVAFESGLSWDILVSNLKLPFHKLSSFVRPDQANLELRHIIRRLSPEATSLRIAGMDGGGSGAGVLRVTPYHDARQGADVVAKYGPLESIRREYEGWRLVARFISGFKSTQILKVVLGRHLAALEYSLVGAVLTEVVPFVKFYARASAGDITELFRKLFLDTCGLWYKNMTVDQDMRLSDTYSEYLGFDAANLEAPYRFKYPEWPLSEREIRFPSLHRKLIHPIAAYCSGQANFENKTGVCLTHGDLHGENIRVAPRTRDAWLIDFGSSGYAHWARDFVELEAVLKFQLMQSAELPVLFEFEDALASADSLDATPAFNRDDYPDLQKAFQCVVALRQVAALASGSLSPGVAHFDYMAALFYQTISYVRRHRLIRGGQRKNHVLVSAALILEKLNALRAASGTTTGIIS